MQAELQPKELKTPYMAHLLKESPTALHIKDKNKIKSANYFADVVSYDTTHN